jgi:HEAT repeat protein
VETLAPEPPEAPAAEPALEESAAEEKAPAPAAEAAGATAAPAKPFTAEELAALGVFLQKFLRLILNPARAEGTEADRPRALFEEFKTLMAGREEMGIYVRSVGKGREFLLLGDTIGTVNLKAELPPSLFAELAPKLVEVFTAKGLIGIQLKRYQTEATFRALVSELGRYRPGEQTPEDLASALLQQGVFQASVVHEADRIEKACELDFRADITLSRLRGDVKRLRLMAAAIAEDPAALWTLRVEDALKTVKDGALRAELLLFADLVTAGQTEIAETDLVREIVRASPIELVVDAAAALGARYEKLAARAPLAAEPDAEKIKVSRLLRQLTARLTADSPDAALQLMGGLYRKGVFTLEELPPELRERVMLEQYLEFFLSDPPQRLRDFSAIRVARDYANAAQRYVRMIGELARKGDLDSADLLFTTLVEHVRNREPALPERPQLARAALSGLAEQDLPATLVGSLPGVDKEKRERLAAIIYAAGKSAVGPILDLLATVEDRNLRRLLCEILSRMGEAAAPLLLARARDQDSAWHLTRNLVMVLGDIKSPLLKDDLAWALAHPHPRVREEALVYAAKVIGADAEALMVRGLADPDPQVRRRAVRVLARLPALGDAAVLGLLELTAARPASEPGPEEERTVAAAAEVIAKLGPRALPDGRTLEGVLAEALEGEAGRGLLGRLSGAKSLRTAKMKAALLEALGKVGGPESKKLVAGFIKDKDALVKQSAQAALTRLSAGRSGS